MKIFLLLFFLIPLAKVAHAVNYQFDNAVYLECSTCSTADDFKHYSVNHFENFHYATLNQAFAYTIVNHNLQIAYFIDITHKYDPDPESGYDIDVIIPYSLTTPAEMADDYDLALYVIRESGQFYVNSATNLSLADTMELAQQNNFTPPDPQVKEVTINSTLYAVRYTGVSSVAPLISQALDSDTTFESGWHKLAGRTVFIVNFNDGKLAAFFRGIYTTDPYSYLEGTAIKDDGSPYPVTMTGGSISVGGSSGITKPGSGSWTVITSGGGGGAGGVMACTSAHGHSPTCEWIRY